MFRNKSFDTIFAEDVKWGPVAWLRGKDGGREKKCLPCEHADPSSIPVSHSGRREFSPESCPLISTCVTMAQTQTSHQTDSSSNNSNNYHDEVLKCVKEIWWGKRTYLHSFGKQNPEAMRSWPRAEGQVPETILTAPSCGWHPPTPHHRQLAVFTEEQLKEPPVYW